MPIKLLGKYSFLTEQMVEQGADLGMPHTKAMGKGLFELRIKAEEGIARIFYCTTKGHEIVMLHSFIKKAQKTPKRELDIARKRLNEVQNNE